MPVTDKYRNSQQGYKVLSRCTRSIGTIIAESRKSVKPGFTGILICIHLPEKSSSKRPAMLGLGVGGKLQLESPLLAAKGGYCVERGTLYEGK